jgi:hypothetical protein
VWDDNGWRGGLARLRNGYQHATSAADQAIANALGEAMTKKPDDDDQGDDDSPRSWLARQRPESSGAHDPVE